MGEFVEGPFGSYFVDMFSGGGDLDLSTLRASAELKIYAGNGGSDITGDGLTYDTRFATPAKAFEAITLLGTTAGAVRIMLVGGGASFGDVAWSLPAPYVAPAAGTLLTIPPLTLEAYAEVADVDTIADPRFVVLSGPSTLDGAPTTDAAANGGHFEFSVTGAGWTVNAFKDRTARIFSSGGVHKFTGRIAENTATTFVCGRSANGTAYTYAAGDTVRICRSSVQFDTLSLFGACPAPLILIGIDVIENDSDWSIVAENVLLIGCRFGDPALGGQYGLRIQGPTIVACSPSSRTTQLTALGYSADTVGLWAHWWTSIVGPSALKIGFDGRVSPTTFQRGDGCLTDGTVDILPAACFASGGAGSWMRNGNVVPKAGGSKYDSSSLSGVTGIDEVVNQKSGSPWFDSGAGTDIFATATGATSRHAMLRGSWTGPVFRAIGTRSQNPLRLHRSGGITVTGNVVTLSGGCNMRFFSSSQAASSTASEVIIGSLAAVLFSTLTANGTPDPATLNIART